MSGMRDSYRPNFGSGRPPPPMPDNVRDAMFSFDGVRKPPPNPRGRFDRDKRNPRHQPYRPNGRPFRSTASRPLLSQQQHGAEQQILRDTSAADKFRNLDEITDSEEDAMSESEDEEQPAKKAKTAEQDSPVPSDLPKWSNPDPYTALPPGAEGSGKRTDVLKLIRKAKIAHDKDKANKFTESEDFISFDFEDDQILASAPNGPRQAHSTNGNLQIDGASGEHLGKRKRGYEEAMPRPPGGYLPSDKLVLPQWIAPPKVNSTPWFESRSQREPPGTALHKEIIDFFEWVKPQDYEREVRADVLLRLSMAFNRIEPGELKAFGSYAAGLYLPVGDMDLVYFTRDFRPGNLGKNGIPFKPPRKRLERFATLLRNTGIAQPGSVLVIPFAKVPIVKFVDAPTGLKVDLSFDNDSGITANETFLSWKTAYPTMPVLVSIIKQFLMIRGLNDVSVGGLGGFSIICLVTSLIQHMPGTRPSANVGEMLIEFFNLYGNLMDRDNVAIRLDPPGYVDKESYKPTLFAKEKKGRLTIIDPNRPENNISGGTHLIEQIFGSFAHAFNVLQDRLLAYESGDTDVSFLKDLVGGNFKSYDKQREQLRGLYFGLTGQEPMEHKKAASHKLDRGTSKTSAAEPSTASKESAPPKKLSKGENRAQRLKEARPDLIQQIGNTINLPEAVRIGGYADGVAMHNEVESILQQKQKQGRKKSKGKA